MLRRPVEQPQGLGPRRGIELARPRPDLDPRFDRPEPQIPPHGVARDLEVARDTFGAPSSPVQLADLANHLGVDHRHLRSRWCHARRLCRHVFLLSRSPRGGVRFRFGWGSLLRSPYRFRRRNTARLSDDRQSVEAQWSRGWNGEAKRPRRWRPRAKHQTPAALRFM